MREISSPLDGFASPFGPQRGFNPLRIFANDEPGVWFEANDANTLFTDVAGTTPVTAPGDAVALQLDKSQGLTLGPELADLSTATVSDFDGSAGVIDAVNSRFENTSATTSFGTYPRIIWSALLTPGKTYEVDVVAERLITVGTGGTGGSNVVVSGSFSGKLVAGSNGNIFFGFDGRETFDVAVSISVRELPGNHRTQATTAARPLYALHPVGGVRNELQYTEDRAGTSWSGNGAAVTTNTDIAPNGTTTADTLTGGGASSNRLLQDVTLSDVTTYVYSDYVKAGTSTLTRHGVFANTGGWQGYVEITWSAGVPSVSASFGASNVDVSLDKNGFYRLAFAFTTGSGISGPSYQTHPDRNGGSGTVIVWGAQLEEGSTATNYQRVGSFLDVSEEGKARRGRLWYNGTSHFMETGTITPGTDKVQVFAGVRKLSDNPQNMLMEFSESIATNDGCFHITQFSGTQFFRSKGTSQASANPGGFNPPVSLVMTGLGDISGDSAILRIDGVQEAISTADQGTGNYLAYPLYFGARAGTSLFFNGYEDTSIIRFGPNLDASVIGKVESYVASKTPEATI